ncbi:MAG: 4-hydroxy-2-oxo-heptane-1,7-dioate aldolase [Alphaproteobacteria bacterium]|nr:MAG: 4-hydroxy-2-oxo-heptane-1,7-dioate aldolase [Alphaproteobacteria bacterium]
MTNPFKAALAEGRVQLGIWSSLCNPLAAEILAQSAFDWVLFDAEHSPVEIAGLLPLLQAAGNGGAAPIVRPPWNDLVLIKRALDIGARTLLLPFVQNEAEAEAAAAAMRYPPRGRRGVAGSTRAGRYGRDAGYLRCADAEVCTLVQVETREAMARVEAIAAVDGIDGVFIGPADLSASYGLLGQPGAEVVQADIRAAAGKIRAAGKAPGIMASSVDDVRRYLDWGYLFVACGVDVRLLVHGVDALHAELRG